MSDEDVLAELRRRIQAEVAIDGEEVVLKRGVAVTAGEAEVLSRLGEGDMLQGMRLVLVEGYSTNE